MIVDNVTLDGIPIKDLTTGSEKVVLYQCDDCGFIGERQWHNHQRSIKKWGTKTYCRGCASKLTGKEKCGRAAWNKGKKLPPEKKGENHSSWKGGSYISYDGYRMVYVPNPREEVKSNWEHYRKEHVLVMERYLGRKVRVDEIIHHIDGDKLNNSIDNLDIMRKIKKHRQIHQSLQELGYSLIRAGFICYDKRKKAYMAHDKLRELLEHPESL